MKIDQLNKVHDHKHDEIMGLIPGYVKGKLMPSKNDLVEQHLAVCTICQQEVSTCKALAEHLPTSAEIWKPSPVHFTNILMEVEKLEAASLKPPHSVAKPGFFQRFGVWLSQTPRPVRWTLALETLAIAALALFVVLPLNPTNPERDVFETLSNAETPATPHGQYIRLMFAEDMTTRELFELLKQTKVQLRQGPSEVGAYTVEVPVEDQAKSLAILHAHPKVRLAQLVTSASSDL